MQEVAAALRQFADSVEKGDIVPGAVGCALVLTDDKGFTRTTYIGRQYPIEAATIILLARGIQQMTERSLMPSGSTH